MDVLPFQHTQFPPVEEGDPIVDTWVFNCGLELLEEAKMTVELQGVDLDGRRCRHAHDCCGHWYPSKVTHKMSAGLLVLVQKWHQNV